MEAARGEREAAGAARAEAERDVAEMRQAREEAEAMREEARQEQEAARAQLADAERDAAQI
eukprot:2859065-Rhodomonas_salina.1